jgi:glycosyl hydrolase family 26
MTLLTRGRRYLRTASVLALFLTTLFGALNGGFIPSSAMAVPRHRSVELADSGPRLPDTGALFGASSNGLGVDDEGNEGLTESFEDLIGRKLAVKRVYYSWDEVFPTGLEYWMRDRGTTPILSWATSHDGDPIVTWADVAQGRYDATIDARAADLKAYGAPLFFVFHHEPEGEGEPEDFVAAYRRIHDRFVAAGVTNVSYAWVLMDYTFRKGFRPADQWYPGDSYVDVIGSDQFNWYDCPGHEAPWTDFQTLAQPFYDYGVDKGKPMMLAEWASREDFADPGRKADWITAASATLKSWPEVKVVSWYQDGAGAEVCGLDADTSPSAQRAFKNMGADPYFNPPPPLVYLDSRPLDLDNHTSATYAFHANVPGSTFTCKLDAGTTKSCSSPYTVSALSQGDHTMKITATDPVSGQSTYDISTWTVDSVLPVVTILYPPAEFTSSNEATFTLDTSEPGWPHEFTCALDGAPAEDCDWIVTYTDLSEGLHTFVATVFDDAGNESLPATDTWTVDTVPPVVTITSGPVSLTKSKTAIFTFTSNESGASFKCLKDDGGYYPCSSPMTYDWLSDGLHTFSVIANDQAGNNSAPDDWSWTVDTTKPDVTITSGPAPNTKSKTASFTFTVSDASSATSTCQLDSSPPVPCGPGSPGDSAADTFSRTLTDSWGSTDPGGAWKVPADNLVSDFDVTGSAGTMVLSSTNVARLAYLGTLRQDADELFRFSVDKKPTSSRVIAYALSRYDSSSGAFYALRASLVWDGSIRIDSSKKPTTGPEVVQGTEVTLSGIGAANTWYWVRARFANEGSDVRVQGKVWKDGTPEPADWQYSYLDISAPLSGSGRLALRAQSWSTEVPFVMSFDDFSSTAGLSYSSLLEGVHTETITATDGAGNVGTATWNWTVDTAPPTATITAKPANPTNATSATFKFTSSESGSTFLCKLDAGTSKSCTSPTTYTGLASGSHTFTLTATDKAGNDSSPVTFTWTVDTTPPVATIDSGPTNPSNKKSATFTFHTEAGATFKCSLDSGSFVACGSGKTYYTLSDGSHTFKVEAVDLAGNVGTPVSWTWTVDATKPTVTITSGPPNPSFQSTATFTFTASETGVTFTCQLDAQSPTTCTSGKTYTNIGVGQHTFKLYGTDLAGNKSTTVTWSWTKA